MCPSSSEAYTAQMTVRVLREATGFFWMGRLRPWSEEAVQDTGWQRMPDRFCWVAEHGRWQAQAACRHPQAAV